jgi:predicted outer membrane repeat protein
VLRVLSTTEVTSCLFDRCIASGCCDDSSSEGGGAIQAENANLTIKSCSFSGCIASGGRGGAVSFSVSNSQSKCLVLENTVFLCCESLSSTNANSKGGGLGLFCVGATCKNCSWLNCRSNQGGGAIGQVTSGDTMGERALILENCIFGCNVASTRGGAIEAMRTNFSCTNCSFLHNSASQCGGAISCELRHNYMITNTAFVRNFVSGCLNDTHNGGAIQVNLPSPVGRFMLSYCIFITNYAKSCSSMCYCLLCLVFLRFV